MLIERMQFFVAPVPATPGAVSNGLTVAVDSDAPFRLFGVVVWDLGVAAGTGFPGQIALQIKKPDTRLLQVQMDSSNLIFPGNLTNFAGPNPNVAVMSPIRPSVVFPANSVIEFNIIGLPSTISNPPGTLVIFCGVNVYNQGAVWAPTYPAKFKARPYLDRVVIPFTAGVPSLNNLFTAQADSDFVWQAGVYTDFSVGGKKASLNLVSPPP